MTDKRIEISVLKDSEIDHLISFSNFINKDNRTKEHFLWEFHNAPAGKAIYIIAKDVDNGKIVGTQCAIPINLITDNGDVVRTAKSEDTLVDPVYRGLNIFDNMYKLLFEKCRENGIKYIWGFTSAKKPFSRLGFTIPYDHSQSLMVFDIFASYKYLSALNSKNSFVSLLKIFALCGVSKVLSVKRTIIGDAFADKQLSYAIHNKLDVLDNAKLIKSGTKGFSIHLDMPYLKWRIAENPYHKEIFNIYFSIDSNIVGNIIFNHHKDGVWYLIHDEYAEMISNTQRITLLKKSMKLLTSNVKSKVKLIRTWDFSHNNYGKSEIEVRKGAGFFHIERGISFVWKSLDDENTLIANDFKLSRISSQGTI